MTGIPGNSRTDETVFGVKYEISILHLPYQKLIAFITPNYDAIIVLQHLYLLKT